jgi:hypothetical protein
MTCRRATSRRGRCRRRPRSGSGGTIRSASGRKKRHPQARTTCCAASSRPRRRRRRPPSPPRPLGRSPPRRQTGDLWLAVGRVTRAHASRGPCVRQG